MSHRPRSRRAAPLAALSLALLALPAAAATPAGSGTRAVTAFSASLVEAPEPAPDLALVAALRSASSAAPVVWGAHGHELTARAAATALPEEIPAFFRSRAAELEYLNPEPDRWRSREQRAMDQAFSFDHYIDLENVPAGALDQGDRWTYLRALYASGLERPEQAAGFLPYRMLELYQRLEEQFRLWRAAPERERAWIENRIVNDAGILGHYVTDGSQPHHTTIHYNGWDADTPNPESYTTERDFHGRFESAFVGRNVTFEELLPAVRDGEPRHLTEPWPAIMAYILESHGQVEELYRLERDVGFDPERPDARTEAFAIERMAAGSDMLRDLWWSAWRNSARPAN